MITRTLIVLPRVDYAQTDFPAFPIGTCYVSAYLKQMNFCVHTLNLNMYDGAVEDVLRERILTLDINVVAVGGLVNNYHNIADIIDTAKRIKPGIITVVGGGLMTGDPEPVMRGIPSIDYGVIGEGEFTSAELLQMIEDNDGKLVPDHIAGLIYRECENLIQTHPRGDIADIDSLPFPDYEGFQFFEYVDGLGQMLDGKLLRYGIVTTSRSCSNRCTFCSTSGGKRYRQRSLNSIFEEIDMLVKKYDVTMIALNDELFANFNERIEDFCERIRPYRLKWSISLRVGKLNVDVLSKMKGAGCIRVAIGTESADDRVLKSMRKNITFAQIDESMKLLQQSGIPFSSGLIFGDRAETKETAEITLRWWAKHPEYNITIAPIILFPGSELYKYACQTGRIADRLEHIEKGCPLTNVTQMTDEEYGEMLERLNQLQKERYNVYSPVGVMGKSMSDNELRYTYRCENCGSENVGNASGFNMLAMVNCRECGHPYIINLAVQQREVVRGKTAELLKKGKMAIWGCGQLAVNFLDLMRDEELRSMSLIDISPVKQGRTLNGLKIANPEILSDDSIYSVIVMAAPRHLPEIQNVIKKNYSHIQQVVHGTSLFKPEK